MQMHKQAMANANKNLRARAFPLSLSFAVLFLLDLAVLCAAYASAAVRIFLFFNMNCLLPAMPKCAFLILLPNMRTSISICDADAVMLSSTCYSDGDDDE
jgi:hypothetical protein